ncbi:hypothetical protein FOL47_003273 [Perkinsus chesapeaki]|uniref:CN hydrolase domain-containing protein n=1 Tax=Perkinsus chesapeaki TaxID=330153 RepID=A0A7J6N5K8_PERCH|nr:hypothetical protein FOL47_003273 [Perkinsus chesapeaki]
MTLYDSVSVTRPTLLSFLLSGLSVVLYNLRTIKFGLDQPLEIWPLALICVCPMIASQEYQRSLLVSLATFMACSAIFFWTIGLEWYIGLGTGAVWGALWDTMDSADAYLFDDESNLSKPVRRAAYWTTIVYATALLLGTFFALSTPFHDAPMLIQPISFLGLYSLEFSVFAVNAALGQIAFSRQRKALFKFLFWGMAGWCCLSVIQFYVPRIYRAPSVTVATITPGAELGGVSCNMSLVETYEKDATCNATLERQIDLTRKVATQDGAKFVVWPEIWLGPFKSFTEAEDYVDSKISPVAGELGIFMSVGALVGESGNIAVMVGPEGKRLGVYGKQKPLTLIGEESSLRFGYPTYEIPQSSLLGPNVSATGKVGTLICYDIDFPSTLRSIVLQGAGLVLNPSQDWSAVRDHLSQAVFRAVENRVAIAKADLAWDSVIVDPSGRKKARFQSRNERENVLVATVELGNGKPTGATVSGDFVPLICVAFAFFVLAASVRKWYSIRGRRQLYAPDGDYGTLLPA